MSDLRLSAVRKTYGRGPNRVDALDGVSVVVRSAGLPHRGRFAFGVGKWTAAVSGMFCSEAVASWTWSSGSAR